MSKASTKKGNDLISHGRVAENRRARHDYDIEDTIEAGLMLTGTEVKSLRTGRANIAESYAGPKNGELYLFNAHIGEWTQAMKGMGHEPRRHRKLLVHKRELQRLIGHITKDGMTLVPLYLYFNDRGFAKITLGLAKGRKTHDKRHAIKEREWNRDKARLMRDKG